MYKKHCFAMETSQGLYRKKREKNIVKRKKIMYYDIQSVIYDLERNKLFRIDKNDAVQPSKGMLFIVNELLSRL